MSQRVNRDDIVKQALARCNQAREALLNNMHAVAELNLNESDQEAIAFDALEKEVRAELNEASLSVSFNRLINIFEESYAEQITTLQGSKLEPLRQIGEAFIEYINLLEKTDHALQHPVKQDDTIVAAPKKDMRPKEKEEANENPRPASAANEANAPVKDFDPLNNSFEQYAEKIRLAQQQGKPCLEAIQACLTPTNRSFIFGNKENREAFNNIYQQSIKLMTLSLINNNLQLYQQINKNEFYNITADANQYRPTITRFIESFNNLSNSVIDNILANNDSNNITIALDYWINVLHDCLFNPALRDLSTALSLHTAITSVPISKILSAAIKQDLVVPSTKEKYDEIENVMNPNKRFLALQKFDITSTEAGKPVIYPLIHILNFLTLAADDTKGVPNIELFHRLINEFSNRQSAVSDLQLSFVTSPASIIAANAMTDQARDQLANELAPRSPVSKVRELADTDPQLSKYLTYLADNSVTTRIGKDSIVQTTNQAHDDKPHAYRLTTDNVDAPAITTSQLLLAEQLNELGIDTNNSMSDENASVLNLYTAAEELCRQQIQDFNHSLLTAAPLTRALAMACYLVEAHDQNKKPKVQARRWLDVFVADLTMEERNNFHRLITSMPTFAAVINQANVNRLREEAKLFNRLIQSIQHDPGNIDIISYKDFNTKYEALKQQVTKLKEQQGAPEEEISMIDHLINGYETSAPEEMIDVDAIPTLVVMASLKEYAQKPNQSTSQENIRETVIIEDGESTLTDTDEPLPDTPNAIPMSVISRDKSTRQTNIAYPSKEGIGHYAIRSDHTDTKKPHELLKIAGNTDAELASVVKNILGEAGYKRLHKGVKSNSTEHRERFHQKLQEVLADSNNLLSASGGPADDAIKMEDLLGKDGIKLYKLAVEEERNSPAFRNATFLKATKKYPGAKWNERLILWVGGPSASGKSFGADAIIEKVNADVMPKSDPLNTDGNYVVAIDGGVEREVSQMRKLLLQVALKKGYSGIKNLHKHTKLGTKEIIQQAASTSRLNMVIPNTFTNPFTRLQINSYEDSQKTKQIFSEVVAGNQDESGKKFEKAVQRMGNMRAWLQTYTRKNTENREITLNNYDLECESKKYSKKYFRAGLTGSAKAGEHYKKISKTGIYIKLENDLIFIQKQAGSNTYVPCNKRSTGPMLKISARLFEQWQAAVAENADLVLEDWMKKNRIPPKISIARSESARAELKHNARVSSLSDAAVDLIKQLNKRDDMTESRAAQYLKMIGVIKKQYAELAVGEKGPPPNQRELEDLDRVIRELDEAFRKACPLIDPKNPPPSLMLDSEIYSVIEHNSPGMDGNSEPNPELDDIIHDITVTLLAINKALADILDGITKKPARASESNDTFTSRIGELTDASKSPLKRKNGAQQPKDKENSGPDNRGKNPSHK